MNNCLVLPPSEPSYHTALYNPSILDTTLLILGYFGLMLTFPSWTEKNDPGFYNDLSTSNYHTTIDTNKQGGFPDFFSGTI